MLATALRARMAERCVIGTFLKLPRPEVVEILGLSGLDFVVCDLEHAQITEREAREVILAGRVAGLAVVVRVADLDRGLVNRLLEAGAAGIQLPRVRSSADAAHLSELTNYPPEGTRSLSRAQPAAGYGANPLSEYLHTSNAAVLRIGQFETAALCNPVEAVAAGLDVAFIGTVDLSVDMGRPGEPEHPEVQARVFELEAGARSAGALLGGFAPTLESARGAIARDYRYIAVASDIGLLHGAAQDLVDMLGKES